MKKPQTPSPYAYNWFNATSKTVLAPLGWRTPTLQSIGEMDVLSPWNSERTAITGFYMVGSSKLVNGKAKLK